MSVRACERSGVPSECGKMMCGALLQFKCCNHIKDSPVELMQATHLVHRCVRKCKFEFNKFNCGNISNMQQGYAFFTYFLCIAPKYFIFLFGNGTYMIIGGR
jgi:hypothetical protein